MNANRLELTNTTTSPDKARPPLGPKSAIPAWAAKVSAEPARSIGTR